MIGFSNMNPQKILVVICVTVYSLTIEYKAIICYAEKDSICNL